MPFWAQVAAAETARITTNPAGIRIFGDHRFMTLTPYQFLFFIRSYRNKLEKSANPARWKKSALSAIFS
jgi:hypothetical protein